MRLIDEQTLVDIIERMWKDKQITNSKYNTFLSILDYCPTVEAFTKDEYEGAYLRGYVDSAKANERPKGEWVFKKCGCYICSECREVERAEKNYCSNCGADMRGGEDGK